MPQIRPKNQSNTPIMGVAIFRLDTYAGRKMGIYVHCNEWHCRNGKTIRVEDLIKKLGDGATTLDIERRMKCSECGRPPSGIKILSMHCI